MERSGYRLPQFQNYPKSWASDKQSKSDEPTIFFRKKSLLTDERENGKSPFLPHFLSYMIFSRLQRQLYVRRHGGYKHIEDDGGLCGIRFVSDIRSYWSGPHQE